MTILSTHNVFFDPKKPMNIGIDLAIEGSDRTFVASPISEGSIISLRIPEYEPSDEGYAAPGLHSTTIIQAPVIRKNGILGVEIPSYGTGLEPEFCPLEKCEIVTPYICRERGDHSSRPRCEDDLEGFVSPQPK